jgi:hypothetical protein
MIQQGKIYKTRFQTGEYFHVDEVKGQTAIGYYLNNIKMQGCPIDVGRLIDDEKIENKYCNSCILKKGLIT